MVNMNLVNPVNHGFLMDYFSELGHPEQKIKYLKSKGELQSIIKGWYLFNSIDRNYSKLHIANLLYGPSYVSGVSVLSYLGLIADRADSVQSMVFKRGKTLETKLGAYYYNHIPKEIFYTGILNFEISDKITCLMANATKALYDHILITPGLEFSGKDDMLNYLEEDLRFDIERLGQLDTNLLEVLLLNGRKKRQTNILLQLVKKSK